MLKVLQLKGLFHLLNRFYLLENENEMIYNLYSFSSLYNMQYILHDLKWLQNVDGEIT